MTDALIVGGGLAGASLATLLARSGRSVDLIEKSSAAHHKVCGEFLSREATAYLESLSINLPALGAVPIRGVRLAAHQILAESTLPFTALSLTRHTLDEALLQQASVSGANVLRGARVDSLQPTANGFTASVAGKQYTAADAFLATGKHDVNALARPAGKQNSLVAFKMYFRLTPQQHVQLGSNVELILYPGGYAGLQPVEDGAVNLCMLMQRQHLGSGVDRWPHLLEHMQAASQHLTSRLQGATPLLEKPLALAAIPYGLLLQHAPDNLWRLGDQTAVIPSFSGDGMSIALHSAHLAASLYLSGASPETYHRQMYSQLRNPVHLATLLSRTLVTAPSLAHVTRLFPSLLRRIATDTRIPSRALRTTSNIATA